MLSVEHAVLTQERVSHTSWFSFCDVRLKANCPGAALFPNDAVIMYILKRNTL